VKSKKIFIKILGTMILLIISACASTGASFSPEFVSWGSTNKVRFVKITFTNSHSFAPSNTTTVLLVCRELPKELNGVIGDDATASLKNSECRPAQIGSHDASVGIFHGFGSALVESAAVAGGAYFIGKGLKGSGDTNSTNITDTTDAISIDNTDTKIINKPNHPHQHDHPLNKK